MSIMVIKYLVNKNIYKNMKINLYFKTLTFTKKKIVEG